MRRVIFDLSGLLLTGPGQAAGERAGMLENEVDQDRKTTTGDPGLSFDRICLPAACSDRGLHHYIAA